MSLRTLLFPAAAAMLVVAGCASMPDVGVRKADGVLVDTAGMTLYTFDKDAAGSGKSACNGPCAALWPPVSASSDKLAAPYSVVTRDDGAKQLAYGGKPLYRFANDKAPGERSGDNVKNVWHIVKN